MNGEEIEDAMGMSICGIDKGKAEEMMTRAGIPLMTTTMYNGLGRR